LDIGVKTLGADLLTANGLITFTEAGVTSVEQLYTQSGTITLDGGVFQMAHSSVFDNSSRVNVAGGTLDSRNTVQMVAGVQLSGGSIVGSIGGNGELYSYGAIDARSGSVTAQLRSGPGLIKSTPGTVTLSGAYAGGPTTVNGGTLVMNGTQTGVGAVTVNSGGTLGGTGTVLGPVTSNPGGTLTPRTGPGRLSTGHLQLASGTAFTVEVNG